MKDGKDRGELTAAKRQEPRTYTVYLPGSSRYSDISALAVLKTDYDALEVDVGVMLEALTRIAALRPNKAFDPWARAIAEEALDKISDRAKGMTA